MATPDIFWWTRPSSAQILEATPTAPPLDPAPPETKPTPKPKPKKNPKASSSSSSTKKTPQRGLGVAQLERIRLKKIAGDEIHQFPLTLSSIHEQKQRLLLLQAAASAGTGCGGGSPFFYVPGAQYQSGCGFGGGAESSVIRSVLHEHYAMDRVRIGSGSVVVQQEPPPELPSDQRPAAVCISDHCELCLRKRILSEFSGNGVDHYFMDRRSFVRGREIKEYEFFPHNSSTDSSGGEGLGLRGKHAAASSSAATPPVASNFVDLSLKLF